MFAEIVIGDEALALIRDPEFGAAWDAIHGACRWATGFQQRQFVSAWYGAYSGQYTPALAVGRDEKGSPSAILPLAYETAGQRLVVAGDRAAEYHAWICIGENSALFMSTAIDQIDRRFANARLDFQYLPPGTPTGFLDGTAESAGPLPRRATLVQVSRPLLDLTLANAEAGSKGKNIRIKINRLKKLGDLSFRVLKDESGFSSFVDELMQLAAIRQEALHGGAGGYPNARRRGFYETLFRTSDILHASGLWLGGDLIAGHLGIVDRGVCHLGVLAHHPCYARHSPGRVHLVMLASSLLGEGVRLLDLTPGGDPYKETLATGHDTVGRLTIHENHRDKVAADIRVRLEHHVRQTTSRIGIAPAGLREFAGKLRRLGPRAVLRKLSRLTEFLLPRTIEYRLYSYPSGRARALAADDGMAVNRIGDLLRFTPAESWQRRKDFLSSSLTRLEQGAKVYTIADEDRLLHYGWMAHDQDRSHVTEVNQDVTFPKGSVVLYDYYTHPSARGMGLYQRSITRMLRDAAASPGTGSIFIGVLSDNAPSRHVIEKLGFDPVRIMRSRRFLNRWHPCD